MWHCFCCQRGKAVRNHEALANAAENGMTKVIAELVKRGSNLHEAYMSAVTRKMARAAAELVERGTRGNIYFNDKAIVLVAGAGYAEEARILCKRTYTSEFAQYEALRIAEENGHSDVVTCLVEYLGENWTNVKNLRFCWYSRMVRRSF